MSHAAEAAVKQIQVFDADPSRSSSDEGPSIMLEGMGLEELGPDLQNVLLRDGRVIKLSLRSNLFQTLPPWLDRLKYLYYLNLSHNRFTELPEVICDCPALEILDLSHNLLRSLPLSLARVRTLQVLCITHNNFGTLPTVIAQMPGIDFLEIDGNPLVLPQELQKPGEGWLELARNYLRQQQAFKSQPAQTQAYLPTATKQQVHQTIAPAPVSLAAPFSARPRKHTAPSSLTSQFNGSADPRAINADVLASHRAKRMGFVMQRNATGNSYVANLHARGLSDSGFPILSSTTASELPYFRADVPEPTTEHRREGSSSCVSPLSSPRAEEPTNANGQALTAAVPSPAAAAAVGISSATNAMPTAHTAASASPVAAPISLYRPVSPVDAPGPSSSRLSPLAEEAESPAYRPDLKALKRVKAAFSFFLAAAQTCIEDCGVRQVLKSAFETAERAMDAVSSSNYDNMPESIAAAAPLLAELASQLSDVLVSPVVEIGSEKPHSISSLLVQTMLSFVELKNAYTTLEDANRASTHVVDNQLYQQLEQAVQAAKTVVSLLNTAIARSAQQSAEASIEPNSFSQPPSLAHHIRELSSTSIAVGHASTRMKQVLNLHQTSGPVGRRVFWEAVNQFLKSSIAVLAAIKAAMTDIPSLAGNAAEIFVLARVSKEIPLLLEQSSYRHMDDQTQTAPPITPAGQVMGPQMSLRPTPLTASIGSAARNVLSPAGQYFQSPFFPEV